MSGSLYDSFVGGYDDYSDYMLTSGLGGVGDDDDVDVDRGAQGGDAGDKILLADPEASMRPPAPRGTERRSKKARTDDGGGTGGEGEEAGGEKCGAGGGVLGPPQDKPEAQDPDPRGGGTVVDSGSTNVGAAPGADTLGESGAGGFDDDDDPQVAEFQEHAEGQMERVYSTLQDCLQELAAELVNYYRATVHVKKVYEQVLENERAESRRLDALEPKVRLLKDLVLKTAGMGGPAAGGEGGRGTGLTSVMAAATPVPMAAAAASDDRPRSAPGTPAASHVMQAPPPRRPLPHSSRHASHEV